MKFELKDFQEEAARKLVDDMTYLMDGYERRNKIGSCCLAAPTGAGKTVIAAAVIEALLEGNDAWGVKPDADACVLWVTDLPSLADQTRLRLIEATDLDLSRIESITATFCVNHTQLEAGQIYFLHRQLLGKGKKLSGGGESLSFWQLLKDTIASGIHLYLFLDEAHRGLGSAAKRNNAQEADDQTIYGQIIDGEDGHSPIPVVVGISATPKRFVQAMANRQGRTNEAPVTVKPADVQASGLLKDDIILRAPVTSTAAEHIYLLDACKALRDAEVHWAGWCAMNGVATVVPLMVVQVPDKVSTQRLGELVRDIRSACPKLGADAFAHVMSGFDNISAGGITIPYVSPELVERTHEVKVLFAKEAVSTGWDCPRAEVIYSMRPHKDVTYITQLLGRMVRTPLAMRIDDDESLNAVRCYLPTFDEKSVKQVVGYLTSEESADWAGISAESGRNVYTDPVDVVWDHGLGVDEAFESIHKVVESHHPENFILAAFEYAGLLAQYKVPNAKGELRDVKKALLKALRDSIAIFKDEYDEACKGLAKVTSAEHHMKVFDSTSHTSSTFTQDADSYSLANARRVADRAFTETLTNMFFRSERSRRAHDGLPASDVAINTAVAAAARVPQIEERVKDTAELEVKRLMAFYGPEVAILSEPARNAFNSVLSANGVHRVEHLRVPGTGRQDRANDKFVLHALSEATSGDAWLDLNSVESDVVARELKRGCKAFYRNPSNGTGSHVLTVVYQHPEGGHRNMHPDFVFFQMDGDTMMPSIVDPHWEVTGDEAKAKLVGLARYAREFGGDFCRIWSVNGDGTRYLDLLDKTVQAVVIDGDESATELYKKHGRNYN